MLHLPEFACTATFKKLFLTILLNALVNKNTDAYNIGKETLCTIDKKH